MCRRQRFTAIFPLLTLILVLAAAADTAQAGDVIELSAGDRHHRQFGL